MYKTSAAPKHSRMEGDVFQKSTRTTRPSTWFTGENNLKKFPGFTVLKYARVIAMEWGISPPHDFTSTREVYRFTNSRPQAILIEVNKIIVFMFFFCKDGYRAGRRIVFNGHPNKYAPLFYSCSVCIRRVLLPHKL